MSIPTFNPDLTCGGMSEAKGTKGTYTYTSLALDFIQQLFGAERDKLYLQRLIRDGISATFPPGQNNKWVEKAQIALRDTGYSVCTCDGRVGGSCLIHPNMAYEQPSSADATKP